MHRMVFPFAAACTLLASLHPPAATAHFAALKNAVNVRVTSLDGRPVTFTVVRYRGHIYWSDRLIRRPSDTLHAVTPQDLFAGWGHFLFIAELHRTVRMEAWREFGHPERIVATGQRLVLRVPTGDEVPEVVSNTGRSGAPLY